ncbi:hypothetical protein B296_00047507, partial [Ensete ventricosum]
CRSFYSGCYRLFVPDDLTAFMTYHAVVPPTMLAVLAMRRAVAGGGCRPYLSQLFEEKIMSFSKQGPRAVFILSAYGAVSTVTLHKPGTLWLWEPNCTCHGGRRNVVIVSMEEDQSFKIRHWVYTSGPCGGVGGSVRDMGADPGTRIVKVMVRHGLAVDAIRILYQRDGRDEWTDWWGGRGGQLSEIILDDEGEECLAWISGRYGICGGYLVIRSLTFGSNKRTYGPYGMEDGAPFKLDAGGQSIVGFFARAGQFLDAIGVYTA